jgi:hypothetical protein
MPWAKMIAPQESMRTPTKNQIESIVLGLESAWGVDIVVSPWLQLAVF